MLCKAENRDPAHCLKEGRRVTRCATDLYAVSRISLQAEAHVSICLAGLPRCAKIASSNSKPIGTVWNRTTRSVSETQLNSAVTDRKVLTKNYAPCRKPERTLNKCMFEKLVRDSAPMLVSISYSFLPPLLRVLLKPFLGRHLARHPYTRSKTHCLAVCRNELGTYSVGNLRARS